MVVSLDDKAQRWGCTISLGVTSNSSVGYCNTLEKFAKHPKVVLIPISQI